MSPIERLEREFLREAAAFDGRFAAPPLHRVFQSVINRVEELTGQHRELAERYFEENATLAGLAASIERESADPDQGRSRRK